MTTSRKFVVGILAAFGVVAITASGCSASKPTAVSNAPADPLLVAPLVGVCDQEGATHACVADIVNQGSVKYCYEGSQECRGGVWTRCGEKGLVVHQYDLSKSSLGLQAGATADAASCSPCTPGCYGFDEVAVNVQADASDSGGGDSGYLGNIGFGNAPGGFAGKQDCGSGTGDCRGVYPKSCTGELHYSKYDGCQADHHCSSATGECVRSDFSWTWGTGPDGVCNGAPDLTIGAAWYAGATLGDIIPVCNRGAVPIPAGQRIDIRVQNPSTYTFYSSASCVQYYVNGFTAPRATAQDGCSLVLPAPLNPGSCTRMRLATDCKSWSGNKLGFIYFPYPMQPGSVFDDWSECGATAANLGGLEPGCSNNFADVKPGGVCSNFAAAGFQTTNFEQVYTPISCPDGERAYWGQLTWESATPGGTSIDVAIQVAPRLADGTAGPYSAPIVVGSVPSNRPNNCYKTGPSPSCPVELTPLLGGPPQSSYPFFKTAFTLKPSADGKQTPTLTSYAVTYYCKPVE